ncbi:S-layer homology domain-containing protein [Anoxynatronum buryatiense]|uniref:S-layer homology domain-containing protein n=1 Tax=Anoxynatronum buryatiense TaxID=489973 RepID=A0AA45WWU7_9CLOT|nr:S-layer homology domain-containing protein [Anoxynatronum buryatiense]SMP60030.1 S-layer homology domain-containing protein [Anoxynatronum buryatiense]
MKNNVFKGRCMMLLLTLVLVVLSTLTTYAAITDIAGHWAEKQLTEWQEMGLIRGYGDGTFRPDQPITRAEFAVMMNKAFHLTETNSKTFDDVAENAWYLEAFKIATKAKYLEADEANMVDPQGNVTREDAAVMVSAFVPVESDVSLAVLAELADPDQVQAQNRDALASMMNQRVIRPVEGLDYTATGEISRAEAVVLLRRALTAFETVEAGETHESGNNPLNLLGVTVLVDGEEPFAWEEGTAVPVNAVFQLNFDRNVTGDNWEANQSLFSMTLVESGEAVEAEVSRIESYEERNNVYVTPEEILSSGAAYEIRVDKELMANNGNTLGKTQKLEVIVAE